MALIVFINVLSYVNDFKCVNYYSAVGWEVGVRTLTDSPGKVRRLSYSLN